MIDTYYYTDFIKVTEDIEDKFTCICKLSDYREVTLEAFQHYSPSDRIGPIALGSGGYFRPKYLVRKGAKPDPLDSIRFMQEEIKRLSLRIDWLKREIEILGGRRGIKLSKIKAIVSDKLSEPYDTRWAIIDEETNEVLDDAQGYGYKSAQNAYRGYSYTSASAKDKKAGKRKKEAIRKWIKSHGAFETAVTDAAFYAAKDHESFGFKEFEKIFARSGLYLSAESFNVEDLWKEMF